MFLNDFSFILRVPLRIFSVSRRNVVRENFSDPLGGGVNLVLFPFRDSQRLLSACQGLARTLRPCH